MFPVKSFGLIGFPLSHSFSKKYFDKKFESEGLQNHSFHLFPLKDIAEFPNLIQSEISLLGLSVTIPYKKLIITYLDILDESAKKTGAVNSIKISRNNQKIILTGYNTDIWGFEYSLIKTPLQKSTKALILGTGGASLAVEQILMKLNIEYLKISRNPTIDNEISYLQLTEKIISEYKLIINTTPLGMFPHIDTFPDILYNSITKNHILFDLTYNPEETAFLKKGKIQGAFIKNGLEMLHFQAEKSWEIWNL